MTGSMVMKTDTSQLSVKANTDNGERGDEDGHVLVKSKGENK